MPKCLGEWRARFRAPTLVCSRFRRPGVGGRHGLLVLAHCGVPGHEHPARAPCQCRARRGRAADAAPQHNCRAGGCRNAGTRRPVQDARCIGGRVRVPDNHPRACTAITVARASAVRLAAHACASSIAVRAGCDVRACATAVHVQVRARRGLRRVRTATRSRRRERRDAAAWLRREPGRTQQQPDGAKRPCAAGACGACAKQQIARAACMPARRCTPWRRHSIDRGCQHRGTHTGCAACSTGRRMCGASRHAWPGNARHGHATW